MCMTGDSDNQRTSVLNNLLKKLCHYLKNGENITYSLLKIMDIQAPLIILEKYDIEKIVESYCNIPETSELARAIQDRIKTLKEMKKERDEAQSSSVERNGCKSSKMEISVLNGHDHAGLINTPDAADSDNNLRKRKRAVAVVVPQKRCGVIEHEMVSSSQQFSSKMTPITSRKRTANPKGASVADYYGVTFPLTDVGFVDMYPADEVKKRKTELEIVENVVVHPASNGFTQTRIEQLVDPFSKISIGPVHTGVKAFKIGDVVNCFPVLPIANKLVVPANNTKSEDVKKIEASEAKKSASAADLEQRRKAITAGIHAKLSAMRANESADKSAETVSKLRSRLSLLLQNNVQFNKTIRVVYPRNSEN